MKANIHPHYRTVASHGITADEYFSSCIQYVDCSVKCPVLDVEYSG